jgi:DNA-binding transcriptional ArsR family regulator
MPEERPDFEQLGAFLRALGNGPRLELLHILRLPHALGDIRLEPAQTKPGETAGRAMARQSVLEHLDKLQEIGVVVSREAAGGRRGKEFLVNPPRLYQILEEFRRVGTITLGAPAGRDATVDAGDVRAPPMEPGPKLVLAHGLLEGKAFPLRRADLREGRGWIIGRKPGLHASLDYDPFVSLENAEVVPQANEFVLLDLRSSRNGTWLNWRRLGPDERAVLRPGDVVGVGRSLLVFRRD